MTQPRDLDDELRRAAAQVRVGDAVERGRATAAGLRNENRSAAAALIDELCDAVQAARHQVARFGLDLHDEGMQDLVALRNDLQLFRAQLTSVLDDTEPRRRLVGRVDDFLARIASLDGVLRGVVVSADASWATAKPLSRILAAVVDDSGVRVDSSFGPDLDDAQLTESERVAVVRIVQNALANAVRHGHPKSIYVGVHCVGTDLEIEVVDDGDGFDVEAALIRAAEERRFGLIGMRERVELLGGTFSVTSRPGGPTRVFALLHRQV